MATFLSLKDKGFLKGNKESLKIFKDFLTPENTPRVTDCAPEMPSITHVSTDFPEKIQNPKVQVYVKGTLVEALPMRKRRKN